MLFFTLSKLALFLIFEWQVIFFVKESKNKKTMGPLSRQASVAAD
jgi:hypothetical protein